MQPKYIASILAYAASLSMAAPLIADSEAAGSNSSLEVADSSFEVSSAFSTSPLIELYREPATHTNGTLIYLGFPASSATTLEQRWGRGPSCSTGGDPPKCDGENGARNDACLSLLTELNADSSVTIDGSSRQICHRGAAQHDEYCCVSWHKETNRVITKGDLAPHVDDIMRKCTTNGISGLVDHIYFGGQPCNKICVSNRGTHC